MKELNLENIPESSEFHESKKLVPGGYVCEITAVEDCKIGYNPMKPTTGDFLKISYDIVEGEFTDYYKELEQKFGFWGGTYIRSYKPSAIGMFKGFVSAVEKSNPGYTWEWDESTLIGKKIGLVLGAETYTGMDGKIKTKMKVTAVKTVDDIRAGKYKVPNSAPTPTNSTPAAVKVVDTTASTDSFEKVDKDVPF